ncbi:ankyrin repeat-containing domain protein [Pelagophyceae sp. CCMP2097]|nr:ankyrin repeat-containing domain protein [Pelagophyceae sp. CCMP2097]
MRLSLAMAMAGSCAGVALAPCARMFAAAANGNLALVEDLLTQGCDTNFQDANGFTAAPLMIVAQNGHAGVVDLLIAAGANVNKAEPDGATPLILAAQNGHGGIVALLLARGANVNNAAANKMTPLYVAARNGHSHVVEQLIAAGANLNDASAEGMTPVYVSALNGRRDVVEMLIESGADLNRATHDGRTPAYAAALLGHAVAFDMLLGALGCDVVNQADNDGWTLAHAAASTGHAVLTSLLRAGCDVSTVKTKDGDTPLQLALRYNNMAAIELLATAAPTRALRGRSIALFSLVVAFLGSWALYQASWALYQARGAGARADAACLDLLRDSGSDQAPRSTTTKRRREKSKPGADADAATTTTTTSGEPRGALTQSRTLPSEPPAADDNDEAAMHIDESSQAGDAASHSVEEVKTETCEDEHTRPVEASPPPDDFDDATTVALLESLGLGSLLAVFREHEIDDSALLYLEPGDMRDMDIPLAPSSRPSCTSTAPS